MRLNSKILIKTKLVSKKSNGEACESAAECKSDNCAENECRRGTVRGGEACNFQEQCSNENYACSGLCV